MRLMLPLVLILCAVVNLHVDAAPFSVNCPKLVGGAMEAACKDYPAECEWMNGQCTNRSTTACTTNLGWTYPPSPCTAVAPCTELLSTYARTGTKVLDKPETIGAQCIGILDGKVYNDGAPVVIAIPGTPWIAPIPTQRHYCRYAPPATVEGGVTKKMPLVIFTHGSGGNARKAWSTKWRQLAAPGNGGAFDGTGFLLVGCQALNRHWLPSGAIGSTEDGAKFDFYSRNFTENDDIRYVDAIIDDLVANHNADPRRIYITGFSNGANFAAYYAFARSGARLVSPGAFPGPLSAHTAAGNSIAAVAPYSGADPFARPAACSMSPEITTKIPLYLSVHACDLVNCVSAKMFVQSVAAAGSPNATLVVLGSAGTTALPITDCVLQPPGCTQANRATNHGIYPNAFVSDMTFFFDRYALPSLTAHPSPAPSDTTVAPSSTPVEPPTTGSPAAPTPTAPNTAQPTTPTNTASSPATPPTTISPSTASAAPTPSVNPVPPTTPVPTSAPQAAPKTDQPVPEDSGNKVGVIVGVSVTVAVAGLATVLFMFRHPGTRNGKAERMSKEEMTESASPIRN